MTTTYEVTTTDGHTVTRKSDAHYVAASERTDGTVRFHKTHAAATTAAGTYGKVHRIAADIAAAATADTDFEVFNRDGATTGFVSAADINAARHTANARYGKDRVHRISRA